MTGRHSEVRGPRLRTRRHGRKQVEICSEWRTAVAHPAPERRLDVVERHCYLLLCGAGVPGGRLTCGQPQCTAAGNRYSKPRSGENVDSNNVRRNTDERSTEQSKVYRYRGYR